MRAHTAVYDRAKTHGIHYTPSELAMFLAERIAEHVPTPFCGTVLDPACGDGELLEAMVAAVEPTEQQALSLIGVDRDPEATHRAGARFERLPIPNRVITADFLSLSGSGEYQSRLFDEPASLPTVGKADIIISNPPYVRTQVLGADEAQRLAARYNLSGRVDLYHAFVGAMTDHLANDGLLGLLCSNRFLTTKGGEALRRLLAANYELLEIIDLGDTKLFAAAVLPAIVIARKRSTASQDACRFTRIYEQHPANGIPVQSYASVVQALAGDVQGIVNANGATWNIERGHLNTGTTHTAPWSLTSDALAAWLETIERHTARHFGDISPIRVGIKSNADKVFLRSDWHTLEPEQTPEAKLLRPVITHHIAQRWRTDPTSHTRRVLYPHATVNGRRQAIELSTYPRASAYLSNHYDTLTARTYLMKSNRQWYEIWVPQQPNDWAKPKLIFPDISDRPKFSLDTTGAIVNGDCYWMLLDGLEPADISVILAVANSTFAEAFYDAVCGNKLYSGRRRYITQYVERFPIPHLTTGQREQIHCLVTTLQGGGYDQDCLQIESELDVLIWQAFGLVKPS